MATYNVSELFNKFCEIVNDGYDYVDILEYTDDETTFLSFDGVVDDNESVGYETVSECRIPQNYNVENITTKKINDNDFCNEIVFTYGEIFALKHAVDNALEYFKECAADPVNEPNISEIKTASVNCRNLQAKFAKFFKRLNIKSS